MKNFGKIISDKDIITKEYLDSKGYISAITSKMVTDALGFTPFDSAAFTKASIKNALGIADWALAANKPSYDDVYLKLTGGTITGNLTVNGKVSASGLNISTATASLTFTDNIIYSNASLRIYGGWSLRLGANGTGIQEWADLKTILGLGSLAYKNSIEASDISSIAWSKITGKPTTLEGYGITDAVYRSSNFDATSAKPWVLGYSYTSYGWKVSGPAMLFGTGEYYARLNVAQEGTDNPTAHLSLVHAGVEYGWAKVLTEKNIRSHAIEIAPASERRSATDTSAFTTYAYGDNGWKETGPALAFPNSSYKGLIQLTLANVASNPQSYTRMFIGSVRPDSEGGQQPWIEVLTEKSQGVMRGRGRLAEADADTLSEAGVYEFWGGGAISNVPSGYSTMLVSRGADNNLYFTSQLLTDAQGHLYSRMSEGYILNWKPWRTILDTDNIGTTSLPSLNLNGETITSWSFAWSKITGKPTTLSGYGITDALVLAPASEYRATTDYSAFATYAYGDNGWKVAGPALAFPNGNYKGLLNISIGNGESAPTHLWISSIREGIKQPWTEVLTEANIGSLAMVAGQAGISSGQDLNDLFTPGSYHIAGGPTNAPQEAGNGSLLVVATKHRIFSSQLLVGWNGVLYLRGAEGNSWKDWRTVLDTTNISTTSLPSLNLNGETITSWDDVGATPTKSQTATSGTVSIAPNVLNKWSSALTGTLTITFASGASGVANYYMLEFTTGSSIPTINLPSGVKWEGGYNILNNLAANTTYQISILNNLAVGGAF